MIHGWSDHREHKGSTLEKKKNTHDDPPPPQDFWTNDDEPRAEHLKRHGSRYIWCKAHTAFHNHDIIPTVKHADITSSALYQKKSPEGERPHIGI